MGIPKCASATSASSAGQRTEYSREADEGKGREKRSVPGWPHLQRTALLLILRVRVMVVDPALISFQGGANLHLLNDSPAVFIGGWNGTS